MRIESDGTPKGTFVYDDDGEQIHNVVSIQRQGKNVFVTLRKRMEPTLGSPIEVNGLGDGDFHLAVRGDYQPVRA